MIHPEPDMGAMVEDLKRTGSHLTRQLLYEEYQKLHRDGYKRIRFFNILQDWQQHDKSTMRLTYTPGVKAFIGLSDDKPSYIDPSTSELISPELVCGRTGWIILYQRFAGAAPHPCQPV